MLDYFSLWRKKMISKKTINRATENLTSVFKLASTELAKNRLEAFYNEDIIIKKYLRLHFDALFAAAETPEEKDEIASAFIAVMQSVNNRREELVSELLCPGKSESFLMSSLKELCSDD